jgi:hypothetical protein
MNLKREEIILGKESNLLYIIFNAGNFTNQNSPKKF